MALLDQLFGLQPQGQDAGGLVQNILQQRFQPSPQDAAQATYQSVFSPQPVSSQATMAQRMALPMQIAGQLGGLEKTGAETQGLNLQNQMQAFQMPYVQEMYRQMYGGGQPPIGFPQDGQQQPQQTNGIPPVGFPQGGIDPRLKEARLAAMMGNKSLADSDMAIYNEDPNVVAGKAQAGKTGENAAANVLQADKSNELTKRLEMNLHAMLDLNPNVPSSGFVPSSAKIYMSQGMGANDMGDKGAGAAAANQWDQINNQQIISEIQQFIASGGGNTRTNQTLERIVKAASGIDKNALPASREAQIKNALAEIQNKNVSAGNLAGGNQSYQKIPVTGGASQGQRLKVMIPDGNGGFQTGTIDASHKDTLPPGAQIVP